jgi:hypothetical protein
MKSTKSLIETKSLNIYVLFWLVDARSTEPQTCKIPNSNTQVGVTDFDPEYKLGHSKHSVLLFLLIWRRMQLLQGRTSFNIAVNLTITQYMVCCQIGPSTYFGA